MLRAGDLTAELIGGLKHAATVRQLLEEHNNIHSAAARPLLHVPNQFPLNSAALSSAALNLVCCCPQPCLQLQLHLPLLLRPAGWCLERVPASQALLQLQLPQHLAQLALLH
jgi:hypothetical protein